MHFEDQCDLLEARKQNVNTAIRRLCNAALDDDSKAAIKELQLFVKQERRAATVLVSRIISKLRQGLPNDAGRIADALQQVLNDTWINGDYDE